MTVAPTGRAARHGRIEMRKSDLSIKLGIAVSQSGRYALLGRQVLAGLRCFVDDVNARGGLRVGGHGRPATLIAEDDESDEATLRERISKLIEHDNVDLLIGPYGSGLNLAAAEIAEQRHIVLWNHSGSADQIFEQGFQWQVGLISPASSYLTSVLEALRATDAGAGQVALFSANTSFAIDMAAAVVAWLKCEGMALTLHERYASGLQDFGRLLRPICADPPDWILGVGRVEDDIHFARQLCAAQPAIKAAALVVAGIDHFGVELGPSANGFLAPSQWEAAANYEVDCGPSGVEFAASFRARSGQTPDYPAAQGYAAGLIAERALEIAGTVEQAALREAAANLRCTTLYGPFAIAQGSGRQLAHRMLVTQWQYGERRIVWPPAVAQNELIYPAPPR